MHGARAFATEIDGADHREMMSDDTTLYHLLNYLCYGKNPHAEHPRFAADV
jgi:hypothetical protein